MVANVKFKKSLKLLGSDNAKNNVNAQFLFSSLHDNCSREEVLLYSHYYYYSDLHIALYITGSDGLVVTYFTNFWIIQVSE